MQSVSLKVNINLKVHTIQTKPLFVHFLQLALLDFQMAMAIVKIDSSSTYLLHMGYGVIASSNGMTLDIGKCPRATPVPMYRPTKKCFR